MKDVLMTRSYVISLMLPLRLLPSLFLTKPQTHSGWYDRRWYRDAGVHGTCLCVTKIHYFAKNFACVIRQNDYFSCKSPKMNTFCICLSVCYVLPLHFCSIIKMRFEICDLWPSTQFLKTTHFFNFVPEWKKTFEVFDRQKLYFQKVWE